MSGAREIRRAVIVMVLLVILWGYSWITAKIGLNYASPMDVVALRLGNSGVSDDELCLLQPFDSLRELNLDHTQVTDKGLIYLQRLKALQILSLRGVPVTDDGVAALQKALPDLKIIR